MRPTLFEWSEDRTTVVAKQDGGRGIWTRYRVAQPGETPDCEVNLLTGSLDNYQSKRVGLIKLEVVR